MSWVYCIRGLIFEWFWGEYCGILKEVMFFVLEVFVVVDAGFAEVRERLSSVVPLCSEQELWDALRFEFPEIFLLIASHRNVSADLLDAVWEKCVQFTGAGGRVADYDSWVVSSVQADYDGWLVVQGVVISSGKASLSVLWDAFNSYEPSIYFTVDRFLEKGVLDVSSLVKKVVVFGLQREGYVEVNELLPVEWVVVYARELGFLANLRF